MKQHGGDRLGPAVHGPQALIGGKEGACIARRWRRTPGSWSLNTWSGVPLPSTASWLTQTNPFFANGKIGRSHFSSMLKDENHCWECVTQIRTFRTQFQGCVLALRATSLVTEHPGLRIILPTVIISQNLPSIGKEKLCLKKERQIICQSVPS